MRASSTPDEYSVGDVLEDKYRLERPLGEGGQAWVWQARNLELDARVAIKILRSDAGEDVTRTQRLRQEARAAAGLGHPAIVRMYDLGCTPARDPFIVMELLEGTSLSDRLVLRGRLSPEEAVRVLLPIADALVVAHSHGIIHRDLKPDNVFLALSAEAIQPKLLDFGIIKLPQAAARAGRLTEAGAVVGSPAYLSPEQARGESEIDVRVDVWSFCTTLYEVVTGELPFQGANYRALLRSIIEEKPRSTLEFGVGDAEFWSILERGLAKSREERWPSMLALGRALAAWLVQRGISDDIGGVSLEFKWLRGDARRESQSTAPAPVRAAAGASLDPTALPAGFSRSGVRDPGLRGRWVVPALVTFAVALLLGSALIWKAGGAPPQADTVGRPVAPPAPAAQRPAPASVTLQTPRVAADDAAPTALPSMADAPAPPAPPARAPRATKPSATRRGVAKRASAEGTSGPSRASRPLPSTPKPAADPELLDPY